MPDDLTSSASRVAGENGPAVRRACGHAALPRRRSWRPGLPVSRARRDPATPAVSTLVCFAKAKRSRRSIRLRVPLPPLACSCRANLASKHTHMTVEAYPPDGPQISPPQGSQNFSAKVARVERSIARARRCACWERCARKTFTPSKLAAAPSLTRADSETRHSAMPPHSRGGSTTEFWRLIWLTIKRTPTRPSSFSG